MITKEQLLNNSHMAQMMARQGKQPKLVLTDAEVNAKVAAGQTYQVISNGKVFWFTDDYCMGVRILPKNYVPSSTVGGIRVAPRQGLPNGVITNARDFKHVFCQGERQITSLDELVTYLNTGK